MGQVAGYTVADYLLQLARQQRRYARVPTSTWDAVLSHVDDPADASRLADSAKSRLLYRYAIPLYRHVGDENAADRLGWLLAGCSNPEELRALAGAGDKYAAYELAERGDLEGLRARADAADKVAAWELADQLGRRNALGELRARADAGDKFAAWELARLLAERGDLNELRARTDAGDEQGSG